MIFLLVVAAIVALGAYAYDTWNKRKQRRIVLDEIVRKRKQEREESIQWALETSKKTSEEVRKQIGSLDFEQLRDKLQANEISCIDAVRTYYGKAVEAHNKTNAVCLFVKEAEKWAEEWDEKAKSDNFVKPPLFGVPISLKECVPLQGYDQTRGFVQDTFKPTEEDSVLTKQIKMLGAIPFVQTNVPQSLLAYNCANPIYGTTCNPLDETRTSGGSSGGESALLAADGSLLGLGGDVGGSIRLPCHFTGTAGIKPSHLRFSHRGVCGSVPGRPLVNSNDGPMAKDIKTNVEFLKAVWGDDWAHEQDPYVPPVRWNQKLYEQGKTYTIGYYVDDGWFKPTPACQRAVLEAKEHLEKAGHKLVPFHPPAVEHVMKLFVRALSVDGGYFLLQKMLNDIIEPSISGTVAMYMVPVWLQRLLSYPVSLFFPRLAGLLTALTRSTIELREGYAGIEKYRGDFTELMIKNKIDLLLTPVTVFPAPQHTIPAKMFSAVSYTGIFNMLDFGAGVVNVTKVSKKDEEELKDYPEHDLWYTMAKRATKGAVGLPVGAQIAGPPFKEEAVLRALRDIEIAVTGK